MLLSREKIIKYCSGVCVIALAAICLFQGTVFVRDAIQRLSGASTSDLSDPTYQVTAKIATVAQEAQTILPHGAHYEMTPTAYTYPRVYMSYLLYPDRALTTNGEFVIDLTGEIDAPNSWQSKTLASGGTVYAKPGAKFTTETGATRSTTRNAIVAFLFMTVLYFIVGLTLFNFFKLSTFIQQSRAAAWGSVYLLGVVAVNGIVWVFGLAGAKITQQSILFVAGVLILFFGGIAFRSLLTTLRTLLARPTKITLPKNPILVFIFFAAGIILTAAVIIAITNPLIAWDAISFWIVKSKAIFLYQGFNFSYTHANYYPLLWPLYNGLQFIMLGEIYEKLVQWSVALFITVFVSQVHGAIAVVTGSKKWAWCATAIFTCIFLTNALTSARSETMYMTFLAGLVASLALLFRDPHKLGAFAFVGFMALGVGMTRLDGIATLFIIMAGVAIFYAKKIPKKKLLLLEGILFLPAILEFIWILFLQATHTFDNAVLANQIGDAAAPLYSSLTFEKISLLVVYLPGILTYKPIFGIVAALILCILFLRKQKLSTFERFLLFISFFELALIFLVIGGWSYENIVNNFNVITDRLVFKAEFFAFVAITSILYFQQQKKDVPDNHA